MNQLYATNLSRRLFVASTLSLPFSSNAIAKSISVNDKRALSFYHTHTNKTLSITYYEKGAYIASALDKINFFLGDFRTGDVFPIEPRLLDSVYLLQQQTGVDNKFEVISAYRSPKTNKKLRKKT